MTCSTSPSESPSRSSAFAEAMMIRAPARSISFPASALVNSTYSGTSTPPAMYNPYMPTTQGRPFSHMMATRSPFFRPSAMRPAAKSCACRHVSSYVSFSHSPWRFDWNPTRGPNRARAESSISGIVVGVRLVWSSASPMSCAGLAPSGLITMVRALLSSKSRYRGVIMATVCWLRGGAAGCVCSLGDL